MIVLLAQIAVGAVIIAAFVVASVLTLWQTRDSGSVLGRQSLEDTTPWWEVAIASRRMSIDAGLCRVCGKPTTTHCGHCKSVKYCGKACQLQDWRSTHKFECPNLQKLAALSAISSVGAVGTAASKFAPPDPNEEAPAPQQVLFPYQHYLQLSHNRNSCRKPPVGFTNLGNSCYANAALQCLLANKPLRAYLDQGLHSSRCNKPSRHEWCLLCELQVLCKRLADSGPGEEVSVRPLLRHLRRFAKTLSYGRQEDAHEFFYSMLNTMEAIQLTNYGGKERFDMRTQETTLIHHVFGGYLRSQVICCGCGGASRRYEAALDLQLEVPPAVDRLEDALARHTADEVLDGDNCYACDGCQQRCRAIRSTRFEVAPNTLVLCLKRFGTGRFGKINKLLSYGEHLDLKPYLAEGAMDDREVSYTLSGVVVHLDQMNSTSFGHYICFVRTADGRWYGCDDAHVAPTSVTRVLAQNGYMLFYQRDIPKTAPQPGYKRLKPLTPAAIVAATAAVQKPVLQPVATVSNSAVAPEPQQLQQVQAALCSEQLARVSTAPAALVRMAEGTGSSSSVRDEEDTSTLSSSLGTDRSECSTPSSAVAVANGQMHQRSFSSSNSSAALEQHVHAQLVSCSDAQQQAAAVAAITSNCVVSSELPVVQYQVSRSGPELLVVRAQLPGVGSAADVSVDVVNAGLGLQRLQLKVSGKFAGLDIPIAHELDGDRQLVERVSGKFYRRRQMLRLNLHLVSSQSHQQQHVSAVGDPGPSNQRTNLIPDSVHWHSTDGDQSSSSGSESEGFVIPHSSIRSVMSEMDLSAFLNRHSSQGIVQGLISQQQQQQQQDGSHSSEAVMTFQACSADGKASGGRPKHRGQKSSAKKGSKGKKRK